MGRPKGKKDKKPRVRRAADELSNFGKQPAKKVEPIKLNAGMVMGIKGGEPYAGHESEFFTEETEHKIDSDKPVEKTEAEKEKEKNENELATGVYLTAVNVASRFVAKSKFRAKRDDIFCSEDLGFLWRKYLGDISDESKAVTNVIMQTTLIAQGIVDGMPETPKATAQQPANANAYPNSPPPRTTPQAYPSEV